MKRIRVLTVLSSLLTILGLTAFGSMVWGMDSGDSLRPATFEDLQLASESYWDGNHDTIAYPDGNSVFKSGDFYFTNNYNAKYQSWSKFAYSNLTDTDFDPTQTNTHQFRSAVGHGANADGIGNSATYAVVYDMGEWGTPLLTIDTNIAPQGALLESLYITNAAYTYNTIVNGDSFFGEAFKPGDFCRLDIFGVTAQGDTNKIEFYLAKWDTTKNATLVALNTWNKVSLKELGKVKEVFFRIHGSRVGQYGETIPTYFCIDEIWPVYESVANEGDIKTLPSIALYPNPASDYVNIRTDLDNYSLKIYNMMGMPILSKNGLSGTSKLDITMLKAGNYIVEIITNNTKINKKLVKLR